MKINQRDKIFKKQSSGVLATCELLVLLSRKGLAAGERMGVEMGGAGGTELNIYCSPTVYPALFSILHPYCA